MVNRTGALQRLLGTLDALEQELLDASDAEVLAAVAELQLNPDMKGSIALAGVTQLVPQMVAQRPGRPAAKPARRGRSVAIRPPKE